MSEQPADPGNSGFTVKKLWPLAILVAGFVAFFAFGLNDYLSFDVLRENRETLLAWVDGHAVLASLTFMAIYAAAVAFSLPGGLVMTITGGFLFGSLVGASLVVIAATLGATLLFLAARTSLGDLLRAKAGPWLGKMEAGFQENALSYLLVLRLVPLFPFFVVNLVPAFLGVKTGTYILATLFGIIPGTFVYATVGAGLGSIFDSGEAFSLSGILTPEIIAALIGLAVLALVPVAYKKFKKRQG